MHDGKLFYPVLGTGSFFILFWFGFTLAYQMELHLLSQLLIGLISGLAGAKLVAQLERWHRE